MDDVGVVLCSRCCARRRGRGRGRRVQHCAGVAGTLKARPTRRRGGSARRASAGRGRWWCGRGRRGLLVTVARTWTRSKLGAAGGSDAAWDGAPGHGRGEGEACRGHGMRTTASRGRGSARRERRAPARRRGSRGDGARARRRGRGCGSAVVVVVGKVVCAGDRRGRHGAVAALVRRLRMRDRERMAAANHFIVRVARARESSGNPRRPCRRRDTRRESRARTPRGEGRRACGLRLAIGAAAAALAGSAGRALELGRQGRRGSGPGGPRGGKGQGGALG